MEKTKTVYQLDTPFSSVEWPKISQEDQDSILELLCSALSPIGQHRQAYATSSRGKRSKRKRKRDRQDEAALQRVVPPRPAVATSVDVGLSTITRNLQTGSRRSTTEREATLEGASSSPAPYSVIFVARSGPTSAFFNHLPQMIATASKPQQVAEPIRLVGFSKACEERLSASMRIPRATSVGLRSDDSAQTKALVDFVRKTVPAIEVPWLEEAGKGMHLGTKINAIQAPVGQKRVKKG